MKPRIFLLSMAAVILYGCDNEFNHELEEAHNIDTKNIIETSGIKKGTRMLTDNDAGTIANMYLGSASSRAETDVVEIISVNDNEGSPNFYAVNFKDGYIIVSATVNMPPILAEVEHGKFSIDDQQIMDNPMIMQLNEDCCAHKKSSKSAYSELWKPYYKKHIEVSSTLPKSRESVGTDAWVVQSELMLELQMQGYETYKWNRLVDEQEYVPWDIVDRFRDVLKYSDDIWEEKEENVWNTAFVAVKQYSNTNPQSILTSTVWGQKSPYNLFVYPKPLGCSTIAVGQILKYYKYPTSFKWNLMPDILKKESEGLTLEHFLNRLHDEIGVNDGGGATVDDCKRVLESYGYTVSKQSHKTNSYSRLPIICAGYPYSTPGSGDGHIWICDGQCNVYNRSDYELYILDNAYYPQFKFIRIDEAIKQSSYSLWHMNWGWAGKHNGNFFDGSLNLSPEGSFNMRREDLIVTK